MSKAMRRPSCSNEMLETADIQTEVVVGKKQPVANRYEWSALPTQHDVQPPETETVGIRVSAAMAATLSPIWYMILFEAHGRWYARGRR